MTDFNTESPVLGAPVASGKTFFDVLGTTISPTEIARKGNLSYLSAASAMTLSGRPIVEFVDFDGLPYLACLGGSLVAVDLAVEGLDVPQRTWLPVMDSDTQTLALGETSLTDINNSRQRCLVKALASVYGTGMSVFLGSDGDGPAAVKTLGLTPDSDLSKATAIVAKLKDGGAPYIEWGVALAACRITDPTFFWEVVLWDGLPFRTCLNGAMIDVDTVYKGRRQRISLPLMDSAFNQIPLDRASTFDWNKAVMRALAKCVAFNTGYGLSVYSEVVPKAEKSKERKRAAATQDPKNVQTPTPTAASGEPAVSAPANVSSGEETKAKATAPATAPATSLGLSDEKRDKFKTQLNTIRARSGIQGMLEVFGKLAVSRNYTETERPGCYAILVWSTVKLCEDKPEMLYETLAMIEQFKAMRYIPDDSRDLVAGKIVSIAIGQALEDETALKAVPGDMVYAGIAATKEDVLRLAELANVSKETVDWLRELMLEAPAEVEALAA